MELFEGEKIITSTNGNIIILTTHRIRSDNSIRWGQQRITSIMLGNISAIQVSYDSYPFLIVLAGLTGFAVAIMRNREGFNGGMTGALVLAGVFVLACFLTRKHTCVISADGGAKIIFKTTNMGRESLLRFIDQVEMAKHDRALP